MLKINTLIIKINKLFIQPQFLKLTQLTSNTTLSITEPFEDDELNPYISLLAISNKYGFFIIGSQEGFIYISIKDCIQQLTSEEAKKSNVSSVKLQNQINIKISESKVQQIVLSEDQLTVFVVLNNNKVLLYNISQLNKEVILYKKCYQIYIYIIKIQI